jgi:hypothetical protein
LKNNLLVALVSLMSLNAEFLMTEDPGSISIKRSGKAKFPETGWRGHWMKRARIRKSGFGRELNQSSCQREKYLRDDSFDRSLLSEATFSPTLPD